MPTLGKKSIILLVVASFILGAFTTNFFLETITKADINSASKLIGLDFTSQEVDSLMPALVEFRADYIENRKTSVENSTPLPLYFNPTVPGQSQPTGNKILAFVNPGKVELPKDKDQLAFYSVNQLSALIKNKKISSVELTQFFLDRLKKYDPKLKCVITLTEDLAMKQAKKADKDLAAGKYKGPLHGIPYGIKDLFATKGIKTTWGATPYKEQILDYNASVVDKLEDAGAVLVAKLTLGALAWGDVWYGGQTRNPWDPKTGSSGSSAGSASAVAAGLVPFAIGTETLGSIVSPSTECGTTGLRPTFGRVSRFGAMTLSWSMDKIGPICRDVNDCAMVFNAIKGPDGKDLSVVDAAFNYYASNASQRPKIGYLKKDFESDYPNRANDSLSLLKLKEIGFELVPLELPKMPNLSFILDVEAAAAFDELTLSNKDDQLVRQMRRAWPNVFRQARFVPAVEYIQANRLRMELMQKMEALFKEVNVIIHPSFGGEAIYITNYTGHPAVVVPNGFIDDKPTSISFMGKLYEEDKLLEVSKAFQDYTPFHKQHPKLD